MIIINDLRSSFFGDINQELCIAFKLLLSAGNK